MANTRTVDFLPEIFQTTTNQQFLAATLDQLVQEPSFKKTQGFVGRRVGPGVNPNDTYVIEPNAIRTDYQLEPGVISLEPDTQKVVEAITYPGITDALALQGAQTANSNRLYTSDYYTWDPFINFDKFVNFSQYYWLPGGPLTVDVSATVIPLTDAFDVTRNETSYSISGVGADNPVVTLVRGGNYTFNVAQTGNPFWIQAAPGVSGTLPESPNISSRDVLGVINNGDDNGTVTFNVPLKNAQEFYYNLTPIGTVDLITDLNFNQINNVYVDQFFEQNPNGIDGIINLNGRTVIFTNPNTDTESGGWLITTQYDPLVRTAPNQVGGSISYDITGQPYDYVPYETLTDVILSGTPDPSDGLPGSYDSLLFDQTTPIVNPATRYSVWQINYIEDNDGNYFMRLTSVRQINNLEKFSILFGKQWSSTNWYKNAVGTFEEIPLLTAVKDVLFYQDGNDPALFGQIHLVDQSLNDTLNIGDILGRKNYTSPNGVVFTNNIKVQFLGNVIPTSYQNNQYYVAGVGTAIKLLPVANYVTPETYTQSATIPFDSTGYDVGNYDASLNQPLIPDYLVIGLDSADLNAWTRANRWFHIDVINASAEYNNTVAVLDNAFRAKRPILEYRGGIRLFNMGTEAKQPVNIIDFDNTDALSTINGTTGYGVNGYSFIDGTRVIFAADSDPQVRNKIYQVEFIQPNSDGSTLLEPIINLVPTSDSAVYVDQCVISLSGITQQGLSFYFDGINWIEAQEKIRVNQPPLFDVFDSNGISFGNRVAYPSSTFIGSQLFGYAIGSGTADIVLGFALKYLSLRNVGDIVFDNRLYNDTFIYVKDRVSTTQAVSEGFVREYANRTVFKREIGWQPAVVKSNVYQQFSFTFAVDKPLQLDIAILPTGKIPSLKVYIGSVYQDPGTYTVTKTNNTTTITLPNTSGVTGDIVEVAALSDQISRVGFYQVPDNLENNPLNENASSFTLGTIRTHYETIAENLNELTGKINGANNIRDLGNVIPYGQNILQQSSPLTLTGYFLRSKDYDIFSSIEYNSREYEKFKAQLLNTATNNDYSGMTIPEILTEVMQDITLGRTEINPFYWSDMLPAGSVYTQSKTVYTPISTPVFDTVDVYNFTSANYLGLLVYVNDVLLVRGTEYTVATDGPRLTITVPLTTGDVIVIQEFSATYGNFVPNTPTKLGLYPAYVPEMYLDTSYINPTMVIRGHDGSITVAFNDFRDDLLLEFEKRIYSNLKLDGNPIPLQATEVIPGQFRATDYTLSEVTEIMSQDFLTWVGWNKLDYKTQDYIASNEFSWNYSTAGNKLTNNQPLVVGSWRGLYNYFYDTLYPNNRPWEMLGFAVRPVWWEDEYGPAPYTSGNLVLWDDLEIGIVRDPAGEYILPQYARPGLTSVIPSGSEGTLLSPFDSIVANYNSLDFKKSWVVGDDGPVESAWRTSSAYPFAVMRLLALTRPAEFFSLFADRDLYKFDTSLNQYLYNGRYRLNANGIEVYGNGTSKASYIDWIVDYNRQSGINSTTALTADLANLDVRLCYRMAAFSAKNLLQVYTEKSSPNSLNSTLLIPDESYNLLFYKNVPFDKLTYSSVIVQNVEDGYAVYGYGTTTPYFSILASRPNGLTAEISAGGTTVTVPIEYSQDVVQVPYGYVFSNPTMMADFLLSYGKLLENQGMIFDAVENGHVLNWQQMAQEFLYWTNQGWAPGSIINLNPTATKIVIEKPMAIVDGIRLQTQQNLVLNQDRRQLTSKDLVIDRIGNRFSITSLTGQTINLLNINFVNFENMIVLDNQSIFADLIYQPVTGARQSRIRIVASTTTDWNGQLDAPGFILNQNNIEEWKPNQKYARGEIVLYKNFYYSANTIVQPSPEFNFDAWTQSDYTRIQQGLLPNLPNKSNQLANAYNIYTANLESDQDLFSYGLIGFRPRQYMAALNLDDVSQVNLYRQFLGTKGTIKAAELFTFADLGRGTAEYNIYENWGVQRATYGANANRSFYELQLNEALLQANPSVIQVIEPGEISEADQTVLLGNIFKESYKLTSTDILTTTYITPTDIGLPSAGYVNFNDVDITVFDLNDPASLNADLDQIGIGTVVWAAKINSYDWGIFRAVGIPGVVEQVADNLDGTSVVTFSKAHGLTTDQLVVIKFFLDEVNGVYRIIGTPTINTITINFTFPNQSQVNAEGQGLAFKLESQRVAQASDVLELPYSQSLIPGNKVWVDNDGTGHWTVLEKQNVFTPGGSILTKNQIVNSNFGTSLAQARQNIFVLAGAPDYSNQGVLFTFVRNDSGSFTENSGIEIGATNTSGFGSSVSIGNQTWMVAGAPESNNNAGYASLINRNPVFASFSQYNVLTPPYPDQNAPGEFGASVTMSLDEHWMYIGAPGNNAVYAYGRVDLEDQQVKYVTDGLTTIYKYNDRIVKASGQGSQLVVVLNNQLLTIGVDYSVTDDNVVLATVPPSGLILIITRRNSISLTATLGQTIFSVDQYLYNATNIYSIAVTVDGLVQRPNIDYTFNDDYSTLGGRDVIFFNAPGTGALVVVASQSYFLFSHKIEPTIEFTASLSGTTMTVTQVTASSDPLTVGMKLSGAGVIQGTYISQILTGDGGVGTYKISNGQTLSSSTLIAKLPNSAKFGTSIMTTTDGRQIMIGAPGDNSVDKNSTGSVYVYDRAVQRFIVTSPSIVSYTVGNGELFDPTMVTLNGTFLVNTQGNLNGTFTVSDSDNDGKNDTITIVNTTLSVGDIIEIAVNKFSHLQRITANTLFQGAKFGQALDVCPNNCSIYIGSPNDGTLLPQAGSLDRRVNQSRIYGITTSFNPDPSLEAGSTLRINDTEVAVPVAPNNTVFGLANAINAAKIPNVIAVVGVAGTFSYGLLTLSVRDRAAATANNKLTVLPGLIGNVFDRLGFDTYPYTQTIVSPVPLAYSNFGQAVFIDSTADNLVIGAPRGNIYRPNTFDRNTTYFDAGSTSVNGPLIQTGAVYTFDYLPSASDNINSPGKFVFGQQIYDELVQSLDRFGTAIDYTDGKMMIGAPASDAPDSSLSEFNYGRIAVFNNLNLLPAWVPVHIQQPVVDIRLINSVFTYDKLTSAKTEFFDFFDPLQGKILGAARQNIDYIGAVDPAAYNVGELNNYGKIWAQTKVGQIWWDTASVRFIDPNQDSIVYASRRWGQVFPGSTVDMYQWVASSTPPAAYTGEGTPKDNLSYSVTTAVNIEGTFTTTYYFWVKDITTVDTNAGKTLSTTGVARYIENPRSSGVPYVAFVSPNATAIYNGADVISAQDTIISIEYDRELNEDNVHVQYDLIPQDRADGFLSQNMYRKLQDSFCGTDTVGNKVPDPTLSPANRYGIQFRPRQSMFADRFLALENYLTRVNTVLARYPISESRSFTLLNSRDPEPLTSSNTWNKRVADLEILSFQNFAEVPVGYKYLVASDSRQNGLWTIYEVTAVKTFETLALVRVQNYDTRRYWQYINWYLPGYNSSTKVVAEVATYSDLATLNVVEGSSVRITANAAGKFEIYIKTATSWDRVGLQDGTIEFKAELWDYAIGRFGFDVEVFDAQYYDQEPVIETRKIIQAINQQLLIGDLQIERNRALMLIFNFVLTEFEAPDWLTKTSLVDVEHKIRQLLPFQIYQQDNQDFVIDYIQEVKPYHVHVRELNLIYDGDDQYDGTVTDFDVPSYYNRDLPAPQFTSPVLTPYTQSSAVGTGTPNTNSDASPDAAIWQTEPWNFWYENYLLEIESAVVTNEGSNYTVAPEVVVTGDCIKPAKMTAKLSSDGRVAGINIIDPGQGYTTTAILTLSGGNGVGAQAIAVMGNGLVRNIKTTIKYDRYQYSTTIVDWEANVTYRNGTQVRFDNRVWQANSAVTTSVNTSTFDPLDWLLVDPGTLSGVDRTMGFYVATPDQPGLDLPLLIDGVTYPGVQVDAPDFNQDSGYDVGNFDINPFDNIAYGPEGQPTYDPAILDAIYESNFLDPYLGTRPTDINVDGGAFIDTYSSHAPEELVPGAEFDTLDFRVYTRPGADWSGDGHGFPIEMIKWIYDAGIAPSGSFRGIVVNAEQVRVTDQTTGLSLVPGIDYTVDWENQVVTITNGSGTISSGDVIVITVYGIGGGNELYKNSYNGATVGNSLTIPVQEVEIEEMVVFVNGNLITNYTYSGDGLNTIIDFDDTYESTDYVVVTALGTTDGSLPYSWSTPQTQYFVANGIDYEFHIDNYMGGTNPANIIVEKNGLRARPSEGIEYIADGSSAYELPYRGGYSQILVADNDVSVWINNEQLILGVDFVVEPYTSDEDRRAVEFTTAPATGSLILISVSTKADYIITGDGSSGAHNLLVWRTTTGFYPIYGDIVAITSWNDTQQQNIVTQVFQGPVTAGVTENEPYDSTPFDPAIVQDQPGSYDYTIGTTESINDFQLNKVITDPTRLWVTLNGNRKFYGDDFLLTSTGTELILHGPVINTLDVLAITELTNSVVPEAMAFRIFQDMRGVQATYRITPETTTTLLQNLELTDDIIYVASVAGLTQPELENNIWGLITINGERIMYRELNSSNNTIIGLRRGTAGTAVFEHAVGAEVYNLGRSNLLAEEYQDRYVTYNELGDGTQTLYVASNIDLSQLTTTQLTQAVQVYVGGVLRTAGYSIISASPVAVQFVSSPPANIPALGQQVTIQVRQGQSWYQPGINTPSDGQPLQETNTKAARFLRGL